MSFERSLSISREINTEINQAARATALNILRNVVFATPIDTGRARGNWQVSITRPINTQKVITDKTGSSTVNKGALVLESAKNVNYPVLWITNNLPYIEELNRGHSQQAPAKFVETAIKRATK